MKIFSIYDSKAETYLQPFFSKNEKTAMRELRQAANSEGHQFNKYAEDYSMFIIGSFDEDTGKIIAQIPEHIVSVHHLVENDNVNELKINPDILIDQEVKK